MDQYLTTYRKDFEWPSSPPFARRYIEVPSSETQKRRHCKCSEKYQVNINRSETEKRIAVEDRSIVGPVCRLLDPKVYPAKTGPSPENEASKHNQPDTYMKKLTEKYPNLCGVMQSTSVEQLQTWVDADRMRTTYQIDFCNEDVKTDLAKTCSESASPGDINSQECKQTPIPSHLKNHSNNQNKKSGSKKKSKKSSGKAEFGDGAETRIPPWKTEYQDNINKIGQAVIKYKIHADKKDVSPVWVTAQSRLVDLKLSQNLQCATTKHIRWAARAADNRRKASTITGSNLSSNWPRNSRPNALRHAASNTYQLDNVRERDLKFQDEKSSDETGAENDETDAEKIEDCVQSKEFSEKVTRKDPIPNRECETLPRRKLQYTNDCPDFDASEAMVAMQKLQKLKELQRRRDLTEKYYSQEIRRLIGEQYFGSRVPEPPPFRISERFNSTNVQTYSGDRLRNVLKSLEPCGTMTTITRLNCGCVQETTRPIFTTSRGRVLKKACDHTQDEIHLKLSSPNPQDHLYSPCEPRKTKFNLLKPKQRFLFDRGDYRESPVDLDGVFGGSNDVRNGNHKPDRRTTKTIPGRRYSDTSVTTGA